MRFDVPSTKLGIRNLIWWYVGNWLLVTGFRVLPSTHFLNVIFLAGMHILFVTTDSYGSAGGQPFAVHTEQGTLFGMTSAAQVDLKLGPGSLFAELAYALALQNLKTTGNLSSSQLNIMVGYRFIFTL